MTKQKKKVYKIPLTNRNFFAIVDRDRKKDVKKLNWSAIFEKTTQTYYPYTVINGKIVKLYNYLLKFNPDHEMTIDHINRDPLDNRISNLRIANKSTQTINQKINKRNKTGVKGLLIQTKKRRIRVLWHDENGEQHDIPFYYNNMETFKSIFIKAFILRKNKEREIEKYRIALCLDSIPYDKDPQSKTEPYKAFDDFMERNKNMDLNFKTNNKIIVKDPQIVSKYTINSINQRIKKTNKSGCTGVCLDKKRRLWRATWEENGRTQDKPFYYGDEIEFRLAYIKAFIFRKNKERELEKYRIALKLDSTPYDKDPQSLTEPSKAFDAFMERNKGEDFNFKNK